MLHAYSTVQCANFTGMGVLANQTRGCINQKVVWDTTCLTETKASPSAFLAKSAKSAKYPVFCGYTWKNPGIPGLRWFLRVVKRPLLSKSHDGGRPSGASASPHGPGMHPHTLLSRMPMRSVDAVVVLQLCSAATAPVSRVAAVGRAAPASSAARRRGGTRALRIPSEGRRLERWSRASRQTRRRHP